MQKVDVNVARSAELPLTTAQLQVGQEDGPADAAPMLEMRQITKDFASGRVLHGVDLTLTAGHIHALVGENGAGKSTLMKILAGVYPDYGGSIAVDGIQMHMRDPAAVLRHGIAVIYQEFSLIPDMTVAENLALGREPRGSVPGRMNHRATARRSAQELTELGLELPMNLPVRSLDVGQQQMAEIAKAITRRARVLVMDEPTARLSMTQRTRLFQIMKTLADRGVGIIYISHFLEEIFEICTDVTVLRDGRCVAVRQVADLDIASVAHLMVGDKYDTIAHDIADNRRQLQRSTPDEVALTLDGLEVPGVVAPVDLTVHRGEIVGFAGLQGSGRTDLARAIVGCSTGARGRVTTRSSSGLPKNPKAAVEAGILLLPANRKTEGIIEVRSVRHNIELTALRSSLSRFGMLLRRRISKTVDELMDSFKVRPGEPGLLITSLSGGNQQKALFARAAAAGADVLILDQPTAGVDVGAKVEIYEQIDRLTASGIAMLLISDDLDELLRLSDRVVLMRKGVAGPARPVSDYDRTTLLARITGTDSADIFA